MTTQRTPTVPARVAAEAITSGDIAITVAWAPGAPLGLTVVELGDAEPPTTSATLVLLDELRNRIGAYIASFRGAAAEELPA